MDISTFPSQHMGFPKLALKPTELPPNPFWAEIFFAIHGHSGGCCNKQDYVLKYAQGITPHSPFLCKCLSCILCGSGTPPNPYSCWRLLHFHANDNFAFMTRYFCILWLVQSSGPTLTSVAPDNQGLTPPEPAAHVPHSNVKSGCLNNHLFSSESSIHH